MASNLAIGAYVSSKSMPSCGLYSIAVSLSLFLWIMPFGFLSNWFNSSYIAIYQHSSNRASLMYLI